MLRIEPIGEIERCIKEFNDLMTLPERRCQLLRELLILNNVDSVAIYKYGFVSPTEAKLVGRAKREGARPRYLEIEKSEKICLVTKELFNDRVIEHDRIELAKISLGVDLLFDSEDGGIFLLKMNVA